MLFRMLVPPAKTKQLSDRTYHMICAQTHIFNSTNINMMMMMMTINTIIIPMILYTQ